MRILSTTKVTESKPGTSQAIYSFPAITVLARGELLLTCRAGSTKDSADEMIELYRSSDGGSSWSGPHFPFPTARHNGVFSSFRLCYLTQLRADHILAASMWIDRETYPGKPLFNPETEGCLPMGVFLSDSFDDGHSWGEWRYADLPDEIGPASLTNPIIKLSDGTLAMSIETNKHYQDTSHWYQRVVYFHSSNQGHTWGQPFNAGYDPEGRIVHWDQRANITPDGRISTFTWVYDRKTMSYLNIHRRISDDGGRSWHRAEDLGFTDQAGHPAILPNGHVVLPWVDRYGTKSIRARFAPDIAANFDPATEVVIYSHTESLKDRSQDTGGMLSEMGEWSYGLPYAEAMPDGSVLVVYYAGNDSAMDIFCTRLEL